jgi:hypothetical protein
MSHVRGNYQRSLEFKILANGLKELNSGIIEISYPYFYSYLMTKKIATKIDTSEVDSFLCSVIDPDNIVFSRKTLIASHGFPPEDVYDIHLENWY